jgi:hypothetical protein
MRFAARRSIVPATMVLAASVALAQSAAPPRATLGGALEAPPEVPGYIVSVKIDAIARELKPTGATAPEAQAMLGTLKAPTAIQSTFYLAQDLSRQEITSTDFFLPAGTVILHRAGDKAYVVADPTTKTYAVMDAEALLAALEGGAGIENSQYSASVLHTDEKRTIAGQQARKSLVTVNYVTAMPLENDKVLVQQKNEIEIWHTSGLSSAAAMDHFFFKFQRDKTGEVRRTMMQEIGFPLEVNMVVKQAGTGPRAGTVQPGSVHALVTDLKKEDKLSAALFRIPPAGYRRVERMPFFGAGARPAAR